jgi:CRP-like cAMP-binding protein
MFAKLTPSQLEVVAESLVPLTFQGGDVIITKGETGDCFYMVRAGEAVVSDGGRELARIGAGGSFGERALLKDEVRAAHITAAAGAPVQCFALHRDAFKAALAMADESFRVGALQSMGALAPLSQQQLQQLAASVEAEVLPPGAEVMQRGKPMDGIYIIEDGTLEATQPEVRRLAACS